mgnify:CR=1 FL=1
MAKPQTHAQVEFIVKELRKGGKRGAILSKFAQRWPNESERTFTRRKQVAEAQYKEEMERIQAGTEQKVQKEVEARKLEIMDVLERKAILTQIARGEIKLKKLIVVDKGIEEREVVPDWMDRKNAINELNKMDGGHAPAKVANTDTEGNDLPSMFEQMVKAGVKIITKK